MDISTYLGPFLQFILPTILGSTSIFAVIFNWRIEKIREKNKNRRELIAHWRKSLLTPILDENGYEIPLYRNDVYLTLRPFLKEEIRDKIDNKPKYVNGVQRVVVMMPGAPRVSAQEMIADEISRIEKNWNLI